MKRLIVLDKGFFSLKASGLFCVITRPKFFYCSPIIGNCEPLNPLFSSPRNLSLLSASLMDPDSRFFPPPLSQRGSLRELRFHKVHINTKSKLFNE